MLPREVRCRFFQEDVFRFQLADAALQLFYPLTVRHTRRQRFRGVLFPVRLHPEPERGIVDFEFPRHLSDRPRRRGVHHHLDGLLLELRSVAFRYPWHLIPFLSGENPMGSPVRKLWSTSPAVAAEPVHMLPGGVALAGAGRVAAGGRDGCGGRECHGWSPASSWWPGAGRRGWPVFRAESRVLVISRSPSPAWRAAAARGVRSAAGSASRARLAARYRPRLGPGDLPLRLQHSGDGCPVQDAVGVYRADELVGLAADLGGRRQHVPAAGAEVQVMGG